jgi:hypothetical protein
MRFELEDKAGTEFVFSYNDEIDLVEVDATIDGETCQIAELTLEAADRWRTGKARYFAASGLTDVVTAQTLLADDASANDGAWLDQLGIGVE